MKAGGFNMTQVPYKGSAPAMTDLFAGVIQVVWEYPVVLKPHLDDAATGAACQRLLSAIDAEIPTLFAALPAPPSTIAPPPASEFGEVLTALDTYRKTSPEMVVFGRMLTDALPV